MKTETRLVTDHLPKYTQKTLCQKKQINQDYRCRDGRVSGEDNGSKQLLVKTDQILVQGSKWTDTSCISNTFLSIFNNSYKYKIITVII